MRGRRIMGLIVALLLFSPAARAQLASSGIAGVVAEGLQQPRQAHFGDERRRRRRRRERAFHVVLHLREDEARRGRRTNPLRRNEPFGPPWRLWGRAPCAECLRHRAFVRDCLTVRRVVVKLALGL
jgi:hypothetical protein